MLRGLIAYLRFFFPKLDIDKDLGWIDRYIFKEYTQSVETIKLKSGGRNNARLYQLTLNLISAQTTHRINIFSER